MKVIILILIIYYSIKICDKMDNIYLRMSSIDRHLENIKTVLITKGIMPEHYTRKDGEG